MLLPSVNASKGQRVNTVRNQFRGLPSSRGGYQSTVRFVTGGAQSHGVTRILRHLSETVSGYVTLITTYNPSRIRKLNTLDRAAW